MVLRAGFHGTVGQPSAQVIDGSLKFAGGTTGSSNQYLEHTFRSDGNRKTFTFSFWLKRSDVEAYPGIFFCGSSSVDPNNLHMYFNGDTLLLYSLKDGSNVRSYNTTQQFRDISGWYHIVVAVDSTISSPALDRFKVYVNGDRVTEFSSSNHNAVDENTNFTVNQSGKKLEIGLLRNSSGALSYTYNGNMSQWYFIDGQALGPGYFGFTDPLTGTWRPKKFRAEGTTVNDGTQWSSLVDVSNATVNNGSAANLFDGDTSTKINISGGYIEIDLSSRNVQAGPEGIEVYNNEGGAYTSYQVNGGTAVNWQASAGWMSMGGANSKINTIRINYLSGGGVNAAFAFRVNGVTMVDSTTTNLSFGTNGFYLPMDGNSPIGEDKSGNVTPNNGSIWSSFLTSSSGFRSSEPKTNAFDGNTSSICSAVGSGTITFTSPVTFASNSTIRVFLHGGDHTVTVNGGSDQTISAGSFQTVTYSNSGNANFVMTFHRGGGADTGVRAIEIDGTILVDGRIGNNFTPVNFGSANKIDSPDLTGGTPILNTNEAGTVALPGYKTDPNASNLVVALPMVGAEGGTSFNDIAYLIKGSGSSKSFTAFTGNSDGGGKTSTRGSVLYGSSFYTTRGATNSNAGDYIERTGDSDLSMGTGDYTIEFWFHPYDYTTNDVLIDTRHPTTDWPNDDNGIMIYINANGDVAMVSNGVQISGSGVVGKNQDNHFALTREGTTERLFVNGNLIGTATDRNNDYNRDRLHLGSSAPNGEGSSGYYNDLRVYKGVAKYTSSFKVGSPNPVVIPDTPSGVSGGSKLTKITEGAVSFDGTNDNLDVGSSSDFEFSSNHTIEAWIYPTATSSDNIVAYYYYTDGAAERGWYFGIQTSSQKLRLGNAGSTSVLSSSKVALNAWSHVAAVTTSGTTQLYINGKADGSPTNIGTPTYSDARLTVGSLVYANQATGYGNYFKGFISNLRVVKGTAVYSGNFTPPTRELTNVNNTKLLCCTSPSNVKLSPVAPNVGITTNTRFNSNFESIPTSVNGLTVTNNGSVSTTSAGTNSYGFTNCANLSGSNSLSVDLGAIPQVSTYDIIFKVDGTTDNKYLFAISNTGLVRRTGSSLAWYNNNNDQTISTTPDDGEWHHLRVTPKSLYFDGVETKTTSTNPNIVITSNGYMALGAYRNDSGTIQYNGAVDIGYVRVMPGVDLGAPSSIPITTNGTLSDTETIPNDGVIFAAADVAATNFNPFNTDINTVRGQETGYATWNPLKMGTSDVSMSEGNLFWRTTSNGPDRCTYSTIGMDSGKFYWENEIVEATATAVGIANGLANDNGGPALAHNWMYYSATGQVYLDGSASSYGDAYNTNGTIIGVAFDRDNLTLEFYKNGISQGKLTSISGLTDSETYFAMCGDSGGASQSQVRVNFGQKPFKFPPPDGFQPLNAANVRPEKVITRPDKYVGITTWKGDDQASHVINDLNFDGVPDFVWIKRRDGNDMSHQIYDTIRGETKPLATTSTAGEDTQTSGLIDFVRNGFELGASSVVNGLDGDNSNVPFNYVAWCWKAGGNKGVFNIDDVGYANASNVNMAIGDLNSSFYNTSETWSNGLSALSGSSLTNPPNGFNGVLDSYADSTNGWSLDLSGHTFGSGSHPIEVKSGGATSFSVNGTTSLTDPGGGGAKVWYGTHTGEINTITSSASGASVYYVKIDGKILVNSGTDLSSLTQYPSIAPTGCSVGTKQGFSIIKYTGNGSAATIPHGLSQTPTLIIKKFVGGTSNWDVWTPFLSANERLLLNTNAYNGENSTTSYQNVNATTFDVHAGNNDDTVDMIAYLWHDVPGLQKFGLVETVSDVGLCAELGFRPALVIVKNIDANASWSIRDNKRGPYNPVTTLLRADTNAGDFTSSGQVDFLSNGFKISGSGFGSYTYFYMAWAEAPSFNLYGAQSNAR